MSVCILLSNLRAEGGPALAADLASEWLECQPRILCLNDDAMEFAPRFEALGVPIEVLNVPDIAPARWPEITMKVAKALRACNATALVSIPSGVHGAIFAGAKLAGVRHRVVHIGNYPWHWQKGFWKYRLLMKLSAPLTPDLVCVTQHVASGVERYFGHVAQRVHVIGNGIDLVRFAFRGAPRPAVDRPVEVMMVARLDGGKDHALLIDAIAILVGRGESVRLAIVGEGALEEQLRRRAAPLGPAVTFLGVRGDVPELLAKADVFAFCVHAEEGLGIALVEAMAVGLPIVASDVGACREVLDGGRCGSLVPSGDAAALAEALLQSGRRPDEGMTSAARERVEKIYNRAAMAQCYRRLCGF